MIRLIGYFLTVFVGFFIVSLLASDVQAQRLPPCYTMGDVNNDRFVTQADANTITSMISAGNTDVRSSAAGIRADVNDNNIVDATDALIVSQYAAGSISTFSSCNPKLSRAPTNCHPSGNAYAVSGDNKVNKFDVLKVLEQEVGWVTNWGDDELQDANVIGFDHTPSTSDLSSVDAAVIFQYFEYLLTNFGLCPVLNVSSTGASGVIISGSQSGTGGTTGTTDYPWSPSSASVVLNTTLTAPATASGKNFNSWSGSCDLIDNANRRCRVSFAFNDILESSDSVTVSYILSDDPPVCSPSTQTVNIGQTASLSASSGDGTYSWSAPGGSPSSGSGSSFAVSYSTTGTKTVTVTSAGLNNTCQVIVSTAGEPIPPPAPNDSCPAGQQFGSSQSLGGAGNSPPVMENIGDRLIIAVRGTDNGLYIKERRPDGSYRDWYNIGGTTSARPKLAFVSGTLRLYVQGADGFIYRNSYQSEGSWSGYTNTNTPNSSFGSAGPSAVSTSTLGTFRVSGTNPIMLETCTTTTPTPPPGTITISGDSRCVSGFSRVHLDITVNGLADDRFDIRRSDIGYFTSNNTGTFVWDSSDSNDGTDGSTYGWRVRGRTTGTESNQIFITNRSDCAALPDFQINSFQLREYDGSVCTAAVLTSVSAGDNICFTANVTNVGATYIGNLPNSFHADSAQPACDAPALAPSATNNTMVNLSNGEIKTWNGGPVQVPSTSTNTGTARLHVDYTCAIREIGESEVSPGNWDSADLLTGNHKSVTYSISSTNWLQTFGGDVGAVGQISMSNPPDWQSEYLLIANTIGNASSDKWEVGGYNQPLVPNGGVYNYFNQRFGANARNNTVDCNSAIPQGLSYCGDSTPLVLSSAANLPSTGSAVVFVDGEMTVTGNIDIGSASIVFIARDNIIVSSAVTSADGVYVAGGEFVDCSPCGGTDSQLTINGAVYAQRMFEEGSRSVGALADTTPSLVVNFAPRYLMTMRDLIGTPSIIWREVAP